MKLSPETYQKRCETLRANRANKSTVSAVNSGNPPSRTFDEDSVVEYVDPDFGSYSEKVKRVLENAKKPMSYGAIHAALGNETRRDLTPSVCRSLDNVVFIPGYIEKFCLAEYAPKEEPRWFGELVDFGKRNFKSSRWVGRS